ncbi:DUF4381 domain-containing protein [Teredinibacter sp. KSP-S5-2]|uniref:DUF4381 domain-containing protein n=1 Tax=Teredinibacter sp. KSP-S5-2 TaxID=3034506 RepID=UPI0029352B3B|nr:DUF4381 domain-containing protein [Teredinibacter sp. KSP-S5-2]WNO07640.1 DUF4381 domain-containing protein [Teredinibacter sp. KSP-S5-2]
MSPANTNATSLAPQQPDPKQALLAQLHDIETPNPVGIWPPAIGWWVLCALLIAACAGLYTLYKRNQSQRIQRTLALKQLNAIATNNHLSGQDVLQETTKLLKQVLLSSYPSHRQYIANLYGRSWYQLLNKLSSGHQLSEQSIEHWHQALYEKDPQVDKKQVIDFCHTWLKNHKTLPKEQRGPAFKQQGEQHA